MSPRAALPDWTDCNPNAAPKKALRAAKNRQVDASFELWMELSLAVVSDSHIPYRDATSARER